MQNVTGPDSYIIEKTPPYVLVEGPQWGDAKFLGEWLTAAAQAEATWQEALKDREFEEKMNDRVCIGYLPDFGMSACAFAMRLREHRTSFVLRLECEDGDEFAMMAGMGFFEPAGDHYTMAVPSDLTLASVKAAAFAYAATEDDNGYLHPEQIVGTMSFVDADTSHRRLLAIKQFNSSDHTPYGLGH